MSDATEQRNSRYKTFGSIADLTIFEAAIAAFFFQFCLYIALRMAHGGFSLGELGLVCFGATSLLFELMNVTMARVSFIER